MFWVTQINFMYAVAVFYVKRKKKLALKYYFTNPNTVQ